ncbi:MAG: trypsin-like peptidase domain-containing protein [Clostridia bacterium]|nr:trypsin-like peptidase domain-containing protein [Clostridia bacterium]
MKRKICSFVCVICLIFSFSFVLSSCDTNEASGIASAQINDNGELILVYNDGREQNLGVVVGRDGIDGQDGVDGINGTNGQDGTNGENGTVGSLVITSDGSSIPAASAKGLRSAVSIICNFQATIQQGGWRPGSSSTTTQDYSSAGSGVIYQMDKSEGDAFIITNYHVVYDASSNTENGISEDISVYLYGSEIEEKAIEATYVGGSLYYDIAVLRIEDSEILASSSAQAIDVSDSDKVGVGDSVIAIGNAQGYGISTSFGIVSVDSEYITMTAADGKTSVSFRVIRVDTAVNPGNSGGGLFDDEGNLIGIVNAKIVDEDVEGIGYAIPSNVAVAIADNIIDYCYETDIERVQRALLGITVTTSDSKAIYDSETGKIYIEETVSVYEVSESSLANGVLMEGDVLVSATLNGNTTEVTRQYHIIDMMLNVRAGDTVIMNILRDGAEMTVSIQITEDCLAAY